MDTTIQDVIDHYLSLPILSISERNLAFMRVCGNSNIELYLLCQGRVIYTGGSGKGEILRAKTSYPKASVGKSIF